MATARDVMATKFHTVRPDASIAEAVELFKAASREEQRRVFGMMVTDDNGRLIGMLSMYDVLLFIRPKHVHVWGLMEDIDVSGLMDEVCERAKRVRVEDIMTTDVVTITPDTHLMLIVDIMIRKHVRRLPVLNDDKIEGIVYISDVFHYMADKLAP